MLWTKWLETISSVVQLLNLLKGKSIFLSILFSRINQNLNSTIFWSENCEIKFGNHTTSPIVHFCQLLGVCLRTRKLVKIYFLLFLLFFHIKKSSKNAISPNTTTNYSAGANTQKRAGEHYLYPAPKRNKLKSKRPTLLTQYNSFKCHYLFHFVFHLTFPLIVFIKSVK